MCLTGICRTQTFHTLDDQSAQVAALGPTMVSSRRPEHTSARLTSTLQETVTAQLSSLRQKMEKHERKQEVRVNDIKRMLKDNIKVQAADEMKLVSPRFEWGWETSDNSLDI